MSDPAQPQPQPARSQPARSQRAQDRAAQSQPAQSEVCPRCDARDVRMLTESPVPGAWTMYSCRTCFYSWRSTEPQEVTDPARYPADFKVDPAAIPDVPVVPSVPDRRP